MLTSFQVRRDDGEVGNVDGVSPVDRALTRAVGARGETARPPRRPALTKRRVIDLMRVGRSSCRPRP